MATATEQDQDQVVSTTPDEVRDEALRRLNKRRDFKAHVLVFTLVNLVVWGIWVIIAVHSHSWWPWPAFLTLFWGIGLVMNGWDVYFRRPITQEELQREIRRIQSGADAERE